MAPLLSNLLVVVKSLVNTALLLAATLILGLSPLGFLTVPGLGKAITVMHIPVILAATLVSSPHGPGSSPSCRAASR